jgi:hypothetical protein
LPRRKFGHGHKRIAATPLGASIGATRQLTGGQRLRDSLPMSAATAFYPIGTPGQPWGEAQRKEWLSHRLVQRSYHDDVVTALQSLRDIFEIETYGALSYDPLRYPLFALKSRDWRSDRPTVLVTGGVHGYETSGVHGALAFAREDARRYVERFNLAILPCVSPWGYETIARWNPHAVDPNRAFFAESPAEESAAVMRWVHALGVSLLAHFDLHETTDSDESEFRPALAARDGKTFEPGIIPDGFYLVGDEEDPQPEFQRAIIEAVAKVTHIALPDTKGQLIESPMVQPGVINYPCKRLGLCAGLSDAPYRTTTEVYPDSKTASSAICNAAQACTVRAGLDFLLAR